MSIEVKQELALHLLTFRNVSMKQQGNYCLRIQLYSNKKHPSDDINFLLPASILVAESSPKTKAKFRKAGFVSDSVYTSPLVPIKYSEELFTINEVCLFRNSYMIDIGEDYRNMELTLYCELMLLQSFTDNEYTKCGEFWADIKGSSITEYLEITFDEKYACTVEGMIRSVVYQVGFRSNHDEVMRLMQQNQKSDHIARKSALRVIKPIYESLQEYIKNTEKDKAKMVLDFYLSAVEENCKSLQQQFKYFLYQVAEKQCHDTFTPEELEVFAGSLKQEREKMKIFENSTLKNFNGLMHRVANRIYPVWGSCVRVLSRIGSVVIPLLRQEYKSKIEQKWGQTIVRHEIKNADWSVQKYNTGEQHLLMSKKIRKCNENFESENLYVLDKHMFPPKEIQSILFDQIYFKPLAITQMATQEAKHKKHLVVFVHGLGACRYDMEKLAIQMKRSYEAMEQLISISNEGRTEGDIAEMAERLAREVVNQVQQMGEQLDRVSFVGHSMGGVIIRAALPRLQKYASLFHAFMTLSSPHVGYLYNSSTLIDAGLWIINNVQKCKSTQQLTMQDATTLQQTFMYKLSLLEGMQWFSEIILVSSYQDAYIPYDSARIQKNSSTLADQRNNVEKGKIYCRMVDNVINRLKSKKLHRIDVNLEILEKNVDNFIGRAAHIKFLNCKELLRLITAAVKPLFN